MVIGDVFRDFYSELRKRIGFLSEDNIRFYWFASMLKQDSDLNHYSLEEPYPNPRGNEELEEPYPKGNEELDLMYEDTDEIFAFEIKFHRHQNKGGKGLPKTDSAGKIFNDLIRLPDWKPEEWSGKPIRYFFLYVTDSVMDKYLSESKLLNKFYTLKVGSSFKGSFLCEDCGGDSPKTFFRSACKTLGNLCSGYTKTNVCTTSCKGTEGPISTPDITLIDKVDALSCRSTSLQTQECWVRLYEIK